MTVTMLLVQFKSLRVQDIMCKSNIQAIYPKVKGTYLKKLFQYVENLMLEINFQNARCTEDTNLNKYVNKKKSSGKVDMVVGLINATYLLQQDMLFGVDDFVVQTI